MYFSFSIIMPVSWTQVDIHAAACGLTYILYFEKYGDFGLPHDC